MTTRVLTPLLAALAGGLIAGPGARALDAAAVDLAAHWAARATLANAVMFSGLGEELSMSMSEQDEILKHAGYVARPPMPDMAMVGAVYAAGDPAFLTAADFSRPETLRWDPATFERTLDPAAQAWTLVKITSPAFHLNFHERKEDKRAALMMLPQAEAQARVLEDRLRDPDGLFAARAPDGRFAAPRPGDQAAALWGVANLILAATSTGDDYWHEAWRDLVDPDDWRELHDAAFGAVRELPPAKPADRAIAIEALARFALATSDADRRDAALALAREHADALAEVTEAPLEDLGLAVYGLVEAGRLLDDATYAEAAAELFRTRLLPLWNGGLGAFASGAGPVTYTPRTLGALVAALNAMRWHGPPEPAEAAGRLYPELFASILLRAGLLRASPLPLVAADDRALLPEALFAVLPDPAEAGVAPVFVAEVTYENGAWTVSDPKFRTADAMFLANMLVMPHESGADPFLPEDRLAALAR